MHASPLLTPLTHSIEMSRISLDMSMFCFYRQELQCLRWRGEGERERGRERRLII